MASVNKVFLVGALGQDPEKKVIKSGSPVVSVSLATTDRYNDKSGVRQERTEWHRLVFWNKNADLVAQYCKKGSQIFVEGALQTREWQDRDGNKRQTTEINVKQIQFLDSKPKGQPQEKQRLLENPPVEYDDDIPF